jgi:hypothetical protein
MYDIPIPCYHQLRFDASRPKIDFSPKLLFEDLVDKFELELDFHEREDDEI